MNNPNIAQLCETTEWSPALFQSEQNSSQSTFCYGITPVQDRLSSKKRESTFPLWGNGMCPVYQPGQLMFCQEFPKWRIYLPFGEAFLIVTDGLKMVRYVKRGSTEDTFLFAAANPQFDDFEMPKHLIKQMFLITGSMSRNVI